MSMLYDIRDIEGFAGLEKSNVDQLPNEYSEEELRSIISALKFANANADFDFKNLLPDLPYSNHQIYVFLKKIHDSISAHSNFI